MSIFSSTEPQSEEVEVFTVTLNDGTEFESSLPLTEIYKRFGEPSDFVLLDDFIVRKDEILHIS